MRSDQPDSQYCQHPIDKAHLRLVLLRITLAVTLICAPAARASGDLVEVVQAVWTDRVDMDTRQYGLKYEDTAPKQPIYLWMQVKGTKEALDRLEADGKLPIRHKWFRETLTAINAEGVMQVVDNIPIPAAHIEVLKKLRSEVATRSYFDWRTWSKKANIRRGQWRVTVVYADNTPVICGASREPCEFSIDIK